MRMRTRKEIQPNSSNANACTRILELKLLPQSPSWIHRPTSLHRSLPKSLIPTLDSNLRTCCTYACSEKARPAGGGICLSKRGPHAMSKRDVPPLQSGGRRTRSEPWGLGGSLFPSSSEHRGGNFLLSACYFLHSTTGFKSIHGWIDVSVSERGSSCLVVYVFF